MSGFNPIVPYDIHEDGFFNFGQDESDQTFSDNEPNISDQNDPFSSSLNNDDLDFSSDQSNEDDQKSSEKGSNESNDTNDTNSSSTLSGFFLNNSSVDQSGFESDFELLELKLPNLNQEKNDKKHKRKQPKQRQKAPRKHYHQPPESIKFQKNYYRLLNKDGRRVIKPLIKKYHEEACERNENIIPSCRDAHRVVAVYFNYHANQAELILQTLQQLINDGVINYEKDKKDFIFSKENGA